MTTKEQERKALEQIKKILAGLDEDGYVATAMLGVIEDAEENIENDWAMSRYDAWQMAEQKYEKAKAELESAREYYRKEVESMQERIEELEKEPRLTDEELGMIGRIADCHKYDTEETIKEQAKLIVDLAEEPDSRDFREAVYKHRMAMAENQRCVKVLDTLRVKFDF